MPTDSAVVSKVAPDPIEPSRLDVHESDELMFPSSKSDAVPVNVMLSPSPNVSPFDGLRIVTAGG